MHTPAEKRFSAFTDDPDISRCPHCGETPPIFHVYEGHDCDDPDCDLVLPDDLCLCDNCGWECLAKSVVNASKKRLGMVKCPHCKGTGMVRT